MVKLISEKQRKLLSFRDKISKLEKENEKLKDHVGELQKVIDCFLDMEDKITLALLNRGGNIETGRDLKIVER